MYLLGACAGVYLMKYYSGIAYCPDCSIKWAAVAGMWSGLQCIQCGRNAAHFLDIDTAGKHPVITETSDKIIDMSRYRPMEPII